MQRERDHRAHVSGFIRDMQGVVIRED
jgi:hypothetical protein